MNKHTIINLNKITKGAFAFVLAGSLSLTASTALAEENENIESQVVEETNTNEEVISLDDALVNEHTDKVEEPKLLPGDFFYFAKKALEKIQLILTFDDVKEAKLLAEFATERLTEAEALFSEGLEDEAIAVMEEALENISIAEKAISENTEENTEETTEETTEEETNTTEETEEEVDATIEIIENDGEVVEETEEVEEQISQNIIALTAAMEKVKNPVAKAALQMNIDKSYVKLAKKMAKLEKKASEEDSEEVNLVQTEDKTIAEETNQMVADEAITEEEVIKENTDAVTVPVPAATVTTQVKVNQAQKKAEKQEVKQEKKAEKQTSNKSNNHQQKSKASEQKGNG